jgi:hypothetical protein
LKRWIEVDGWIGLLDQSADCPEAEARHGQTRSGLKWWMDGWGYLTSLPIVVKPKPATVRLEVVYRGGLSGWLIEVGCLTSLPIVLKPKPATVRLEVVARGGLIVNWGDWSKWIT